MNKNKCASVLSRYEQWSGGILSVSAMHLPSQLSIEHNATQEFFLCSTYKLPIAACLLRKVEMNELSLADQITIEPHDLRISLMSTLNQLNYTVPVRISVLNLLTFMLQESCNSATDIILKLIGGPSVVTQYMKNIEINDVHIDRSTLELLLSFKGLNFNTPRCSIDEYRRMVEMVSTEEREKAQKKFNTDKRDHGTTKGMVTFLKKIIMGEALNKENSELLLKIMQRCKIGSQRLMGILPPYTKVSHKTGTAEGYTHDTGVIYLPESAECIAIAVFLQDTGKSHSADERILAEVARCIYDYFLLK